MMTTTEYLDFHRDELVAILRQNVPKYFSDGDVADFQRYLSERKWDGHDVFVDQGDRVVGCASFYWKSRSAIGLSWTFFAPGRIGHRRILPELEKYLTSIFDRVGASHADLMFSLNTTPQVARVLHRIGFVTLEKERDGYGSGYDKVTMERRRSPMS
jgi:hypothetical protein